MPREPSDTEREIVRLGISGDGVVEMPKGPEFVSGALPGELVTANPEGGWTLAAPRSTERRTIALCPHLTRCGGCSVQHMSDDLYQRWKSTLLPEALRTQGLTANIRPMISVPRASRRRAVLAVRRAGNDVTVGFYGARSHVIEPITACAVLTPAIVERLQALRAIAMNLLAPDTEAHISVIATAHGLDVDFEGGKKSLLPTDRLAVVGLAARHPIVRLSHDGDTIVERKRPRLTIAGIDVVVPPAAFIQATAESEAAMQEIALEALTKPKPKRAADLFAGLGTFTLALARCTRVMAIDSDRALLEALATGARNAQGLKPIETKVRDLFRDPLSPKELEAYDTVLFDPPRAGAKAQTEALARSKLRTVIAVSCNPATLARDLRTLVDGGYRIETVTPVDQFLFTPHLEAIAILRR